MKKKVVFLTGTRADYGKIKSLMAKVLESDEYELDIFVTGMHMLSKYGSTYKEIEKDGFKNTFKFVNTKVNQNMDITLSNTIVGFSNYVSELQPDLIVVHGDRVEALAGAVVGALNNVKVAHIEGGEVSGTIDESIRHAITKFAHIHLVANNEAKQRVIQLGESPESIYVIGSPDIDIMFSDTLPPLDEAFNHYEIDFDQYAIFMYHPVTTEIHNLQENIKQVVDALIESNENYIVVYPNNDEGSSIILEEFDRFKGNPKFKVFPSIKFEFFLTFLKYCKFMIGNSSAGVRETSVYGVPSIDLGSRQQGRYDLELSKNIISVKENKAEIVNQIKEIDKVPVIQVSPFGEGNSDERFLEILQNSNVWDKKFQKKFIGLNQMN
ncbi:UDP-N-acetylglucosamine 2-epimerase [Cytobacillus firmus]|uniref:UDP-N-acetylglucosamine 2-epimerase n=1 Tax=Cytobacillus firmus TaxID=1399 RepID=UPI002162BEC9|nr:UDP-N-acetylglucosamine 2-epimerase [Cytobacillus firmus]MCS0654761.1 UDP-N-acetylglucosamine 2-epimerase [Cytobacillus firmus]